jgi:hypothetical protein
VQLKLEQNGEASYIVISSVVRGSEAWEAGLQPGQCLVGISDPNREHVWQVEASASFRFVRDAIRMRIAPTIVIEVEASSPLPEVRRPTPRPEPASPASQTTLSAAASVDMLDSVLGTMAKAEEEKEGRQETVAERLEQSYQYVPLVQVMESWLTIRGRALPKTGRLTTLCASTCPLCATSFWSVLLLCKIPVVHCASSHI